MRSIMIALSADGHFVARANVGRFKMEGGRWFDTGLPRGFSDLFGVRAGDGRSFFVEVKTATGRATAEQLAFIAAMQKRGAVAGVARSVQDARLILAG